MSVLFVGIDVGKQKIVLARLEAGRETRSVEEVIANTPSAVKKYFARCWVRRDVVPFGVC